MLFAFFWVILRPGNYPEESMQHTEHGEILKSRNSTCFGQFLCPSSWVFHCTHSNGICHTGSGWSIL